MACSALTALTTAAVAAVAGRPERDGAQRVRALSCPWREQEVLKETGIVLFAYPKANTPGCTNQVGPSCRRCPLCLGSMRVSAHAATHACMQACGFRDNYEAFKKAGYEIYCISGDKPKPQLNWKVRLPTGKQQNQQLESSS